MPKHYVFLFFAILTETMGTTLLPLTNQFTRLLPTAGVAVAYSISFYLLSKTVQLMPVGIMYAIWSGLGIVLIATIGFFAFGQRLDLPAIAGIGLILAGILVIHLFSASSMH